MKLETNPGVDRIKELMKERLLPIPKFRSRVVFKKPGGKVSHFEEVANFDDAYHFEEIAEEIRDDDELDSRVVNSVKEWKCDMQKPLWKAMIVPRMTVDGSCNIVMVLNHAIGDGISLTDVLLNKVIDRSDEVKVKSSSASPPASGGGAKILSLWDKIKTVVWVGGV